MATRNSSRNERVSRIKEKAAGSRRSRRDNEEAPVRVRRGSRLSAIQTRMPEVQRIRVMADKCTIFMQGDIATDSEGFVTVTNDTGVRKFPKSAVLFALGNGVCLQYSGILATFYATKVKVINGVTNFIDVRGQRGAIYTDNIEITAAEVIQPDPEPEAEPEPEPAPVRKARAAASEVGADFDFDFSKGRQRAEPAAAAAPAAPIDEWAELLGTGK